MTPVERAAAMRELLGADLDPVRHGSICPVHPTHKIGLVGEAPGPNTRADLPFYPYPVNSAAGRMVSHLGWSMRQYLSTFARANLLDEYPGPSFPVRRGRDAVPAVLMRLLPRPLLLMGKGVSASVGVPPDYPVLTWADLTVSFAQDDVTHLRQFRCAVVPHTSGRNLWYNDPENRARIREFVNAAVVS